MSLICFTVIIVVEVELFHPLIADVDPYQNLSDQKLDGPYEYWGILAIAAKDADVCQPKSQLTWRECCMLTLEIRIPGLILRRNFEQYSKT